MLQWLQDNLGEDTGTWLMRDAKQAGLEASDVYLEYVNTWEATTFITFFKQMKDNYSPAGRTYVKKRHRNEPMEPSSTSGTNVPASLPTTSSTPLPTSSLKKRKRRVFGTELSTNSAV